MNQLMASPPESKAAPVPCPRCKQPLVDPNGIGWCKACGYCHSMAESAPKAPEPVQPQEAKGPSNTITATGYALLQTPSWAWVTLIGTAAIVATTIVLSRRLRLEPFDRALYATIQIAAGVGLMFLGQFIGVMRIASLDLSITFLDVLVPFRLYGLALKHLPTSRITVFFGAWGLAAILTASIFIGGLDHWLKYIPSSQKTNQRK